MNILKKRLFTAVMLTGALAAMPALAEDTYFKQDRGPLSPLFREGSCLYRVIYGTFFDIPFGAVQLYGGTCNFGSRLPYVILHVEPNQAIARSGDPSAGNDKCGPYISMTAAGPAGSNVTSMSVYFPATDSFKRFGSNGSPPPPANSCP